jgi:hypothetical protein
VLITIAIAAYMAAFPSPMLSDYLVNSRSGTTGEATTTSASRSSDPQLGLRFLLR